MTRETTKRNRSLFLGALIVLITITVLYTLFLVNFDDERYVFKGSTEIFWDEAADVLAERPSDVTIYDPKPGDNMVMAVYDFQISGRNGPPPEALHCLDFTVDRDPGAWIGFGIVTAVLGVFWIAVLAIVLAYGLRKE